MKRPLHWASVFAVCLLAAACASGPILPEPGSHEVSVVSRGCERLSRHQFEVCYAYLVNDSLLARLPWYEVGRQPDLRQVALTRLRSRYYGPARRFLIRQTRRWPDHVEVSVPALRIVGAVHVTANLAVATIRTVETWRVRAERADGTPGRVLFAEKNARHTITLRRAPTILCFLGHCLHKWVVVSIR